MNMKFTKLILIILLFSCSCVKNRKDASEIFSGYKCIASFSKKIELETGLVLYSYGANNNLPKGYPFKNEVVTVSADYKLKKTRRDTVSLEQARKMIVWLIGSIVERINSDLEVRQYLEIYPFTYDLLATSILFKDENNIDLGTGISQVYFHRGKIKYERYDIHEYTGTYPARGKHYFIHEETYPEALAIVQKGDAPACFR